MIDSIRGRLTAWYVAVLAATLVLFELTVYAVLARSLYSRIDDTLAAAIDTTAISLANDIGEGQSRAGAAVATVDELSSRYVAVAVFDTEGQLLAARQVDDDTPARLPAASTVPDHDPLLFDASEDDDPDDRIRIAIRRVSVAPEAPPFIVHVSTSLEAIDEEVRDIRRVLLLSIPVALLVAGGAGWFMALKSLNPVMAMADRARRMGAGSLDQRLPVGNPRDELGRLAATFNELLGRLDAAFRRQQQFMADASHELRTPLSTIRAAAGVTLQQPRRAEDEYREALGIIDRQAQRLTGIVSDLFTLARADAGHLPLRRAPFQLDELLHDASHEAQLRWGRAATVSVNAPTGAPCVADEELVSRLVTNLIDNAIAHSPAETPVGVTLERGSGHYRILVTDRGPGIPPEAQPHVFERFFRADAARTRTAGATAGAGLGLAIARSIAIAHGGSLELVSSGPGGSVFAAELPTDSR